MRGNFVLPDKHDVWQIADTQFVANVLSYALAAAPTTHASNASNRDDGGRSGA